MIERRTRIREAMDWRAAVVAGVVAGAISLLVQTLYFGIASGAGPWLTLRYTAAIVLGEGVLPPPVTFNLTMAVAGVLIQLALSVIATVILAFIVHRWRMAISIFGGALFGLALYAISYYTLTIAFPWLFALRTWPSVIAYVLFGALAGGIYEALERDRLVIVREG